MMEPEPKTNPRAGKKQDLACEQDSGSAASLTARNLPETARNAIVRIQKARFGYGTARFSRTARNSCGLRPSPSTTVL